MYVLPSLQFFIYKAYYGSAYILSAYLWTFSPTLSSLKEKLEVLCYRIYIN